MSASWRCAPSSAQPGVDAMHEVSADDVDGAGRWGKATAVATQIGCAPHRGRRPARRSRSAELRRSAGVRSVRAAAAMAASSGFVGPARAARPSSAAAAAPALVVGDDHRQRGRADAAASQVAPPPAPICRSWREEGGEVTLVERDAGVVIARRGGACRRRPGWGCRGGGDLDRTAKAERPAQRAQRANSEAFAASVPPMKTPMLRRLVHRAARRRRVGRRKQRVVRAGEQLRVRADQGRRTWRRGRR